MNEKIQNPIEELQAVCEGKNITLAMFAFDASYKYGGEVSLIGDPDNLMFAIAYQYKFLKERMWEEHCSKCKQCNKLKKLIQLLESDFEGADESDEYI